MTDPIQHLLDAPDEPELSSKPLGWRPSDYRQGANHYRLGFNTSPGICLDCGARTLKGVCALCS